MWHRAHIVILFVFGLSIGVVCSANQPSAALELTIEGEPVQGGLLFARTTPGAVVHLDERPLKLDAEGRFVFGFFHAGCVQAPSGPG